MSLTTEQIKEKLDIVDVIGSYIKVEKAGINFKARCPFHNEKTPSFFISSSRQTFYCFGCGAKGDVFSFVEQFEGLDFKETLQKLADKAGVKLEKFAGKTGEIEGNDRLLKHLEAATQLFEKNLLASEKAKAYLESRGLKPETIKKWRIGLAEDLWRGLYDALLSQGATHEELLGAGLIKKVTDEKSGGAEKYYDVFRDRIIFPIFDNQNRVIAFSGRTLKSDTSVPKYLNSPESKLFYKSEVLYGLNFAKTEIRKLDYAILVEGQMDLVMSHQAGISNTVASSGTALTGLHLQKIQKLTNRVIIAYDSDSAGVSAARRAAELALSLGLETKITSLKEGEDPASIIKNSPEEWREALKKSAPFIDHLIQNAFLNLTGALLNKEIIKNILPLISLLQSQIEQSQYIKKIANKMRIPEESVWQDFRKVMKNEPITEREYTDKKLETIPQTERVLASLIYLAESRGEKETSLRDHWTSLVGENAVSKVLNDLEPDKDSLMFEAERYDEDIIKKEILGRLEIQILRRRLQELAKALDDPSTGDATKEPAKKEFANLSKKLQNLINQI